MTPWWLRATFYGCTAAIVIDLLVIPWAFRTQAGAALFGFGVGILTNLVAVAMVRRP